MLNCSKRHYGLTLAMFSSKNLREFPRIARFWGAVAGFHAHPFFRPGCDLDTVPNWFKFGDERSVGTLSKLSHDFTVPHAQVYRAKFWHNAAECLIDVPILTSSFQRAFTAPNQNNWVRCGESTMSKLGLKNSKLIVATFVNIWHTVSKLRRVGFTSNTSNNMESMISQRVFVWNRNGDCEW